MTLVRVLAAGMLASALGAPGCTPRGGAGATSTTAPGEGGAAGTAGPELGPTEQLEALRDQIARAREADTLTSERCQAWADELIALHVRHGEPYVRARLEAATLLRACGRPLDARSTLLEALEGMPRWAQAEALNTLGVLAHEDGDVGGALVHLNAALRADPALHEARSNLVRLLSRIYADGGSRLARDDAQRLLEAWLELAPDDPRVRVQQARLRVIQARREPDALHPSPTELRHAAELALTVLLHEPHPPEVQAKAFVVLGELWLDRDDERRALAALRRAHELDPRQGAAALMAAPLLLRIRDFLGARDVLLAAAGTVDPAEERTRLRLLAVAWRGLREHEEAARIYERLLSVPEPEPIDMYNRAQLAIHRVHHAETFEPAELKLARRLLAEVVTATQGQPAHAELARRARADLQELDVLLAPGLPTRMESPEAKALEALERKRWPEERKRRLELEAKAREAWEAEQRESGSAR